MQTSIQQQALHCAHPGFIKRNRLCAAGCNPPQTLKLGLRQISVPAAPAPTTRQQHALATRLQAAPKSSDVASFITGNPVGQVVSGLVGTPVFLAMEVTGLLALLALTDAAYSGDWSRIGVISADTEPLLQKLTILAWSLHAVCGLIAANIATSKGRSGSSAALKGLVFGSLHVFEELVLQPEGRAARKATANTPTGRR